MVLVADNDPDTRELAGSTLKKSGFNVVNVADGRSTLQTARELLPDLILLEVALPEIDGLEVCRTLRRGPATASIPIVFLTAKRSEPDRVLGLELGADDYITKPFSPRELVLRIRRVLRSRQNQQEMDLMRIGELVINVPNHEVTAAGRPVNLTLIEFKLLTLLARRRGLLQSRDQLLKDVWGYEKSLDTRTVDTHMRRLRAKLGAAGRNLKAVYGMGYRFDE